MLQACAAETVDDKDGGLFLRSAVFAISEVPQPLDRIVWERNVDAYHALDSAGLPGVHVNLCKVCTGVCTLGFHPSRTPSRLLIVSDDTPKASPRALYP